VAVYNYLLELQLIFQRLFVLVQSTELVDLLLIFASDFHVLAARGRLVFLCELPVLVSSDIIKA
jgi:hypothetical protein